MTNSGITAVLAATAVAACSPSAIAEMWSGPSTKTSTRLRDLARQGRFFATTDFDFDPTKPDKYADYRGKPMLTRGQARGTLPSGRRPWLSDGSRTLFGITFDKPFTGNQLPEERPIAFDTVIVEWGSCVPETNGWGAFVVTKDRQTVLLPADRSKRIYPYDNTTMEFPPTTIETLYIGLKGKEDGIDNYVEVKGLHVLHAAKLRLRSLNIHQQGCYLVRYCGREPGRIFLIAPVAPYFFHGRTVIAHSHLAKGVFSSVWPFVEYGGKRIRATKNACAVTDKSTDEYHEIAYELRYELPGLEEEAVLDVRAEFYRRAEESMVLTMRRGVHFPEGARIGLTMNALRQVFGDCLPEDKDLDVAARQEPIEFDTPAGFIGVGLRGPDTLHAGHRETKGARHAERELNVRGQDHVPYIAFETSTTEPELRLALSLPIGPRAKLPEKPGTWYDAPADQHRKGYGPFLAEDLELLEVINCGDPDDPHACYDITNDPIVENADNREYQRQHGIRVDVLRQLRRIKPGCIPTVIPLIDNPEKGSVPITTVLGKPCRAIGDYYGTYFRYALNTRFKRNVPYLIVVEHAFDRTRRGTITIPAFHPKAFNQASCGGLDTGESPEGGFRKECMLFGYPYMLEPPGSVFPISQYDFSIAIGNAWTWQGGWLKAPGPAVSRIEFYRVKRMPRLPDIRGLEPAPRQKRVFSVLAEETGPGILSKHPHMVGYNRIWAYKCAPSNLRTGMVYGDTMTGNTSSFHPGTLLEYEWLLADAEEKGIYIKTHFSELMKLGTVDHDRGRSFCPRAWRYDADAVPLSPSQEEREYIARKLGRALSRLAGYRSLRGICLADIITGDRSVFTLRNMKDFSSQTGVEFTASPLGEKNAERMLEVAPGVRKAWMKWAGRKRYEFHKWLLKEMCQYRDDLLLVLNAPWFTSYTVYYYTLLDERAFSRKRTAEKGISDFLEYLQFWGYAPELYKGQEGFSFQLGAGMPATSLEYHRYSAPEKFVPNVYKEPWFKTLRACFREGLDVHMRINYDESAKPLYGWATSCFKNRTELRRSFIEALLANARCIEIASYKLPWKGRLADVREFAIPFRLLPFTEPEPFEGEVLDAPDGVTMRKHGDRYALIHAGSKNERVTLELAEGQTDMWDFSRGYCEPLSVYHSKKGSRCVDVSLRPWSLKVLSCDARKE